MSAPPIAERADIHKSCKSLENILNILNEYCEAVGAIVTLQKKLAKVLRETAALKVTGEVAGGAFSASANIFEALSEIDGKYTKVADKEYDGISTEVKKWFKRLVKEEKAHDERIENANAKIKQAGQSYEKKSKKKAIDASEEHARYINLISTLGPEISQEKYNHASNVTQRHNAVTFNVAACLARIADAEWLKACEGVRRFAPTIGNLGQWRAMCEGGWPHPLPQGLPGADRPEDNTDSNTNEAPNQTDPSPRNLMLEIPESNNGGPSVTPPRYSPAAQDDTPSPVQQRQPLPSPGRSPPTQLSPPQSSAPAPRTPPSAFDTLKQPFFDPVTGSVRTLSAFPSPPTHFPIPPPRKQTQSSTTASHSGQSSLSTLTTPQALSESPLSSNGILWGNSEGNREIGSSGSQPSQGSATQSYPPSPEQRYQPPSTELAQGEAGPVALEVRRPLPVRAQTAISSLRDFTEDKAKTSTSGNTTIPGQWDEPAQLNKEIEDSDREFGVDRSLQHGVKYRSYDALRSSGVDRSDTDARGGSMVAAMRNRYSNNNGSTSPPPRELPRIPLSVTTLASKYQANDVQASPQQRANSPPIARQQSLPLDAIRSMQEPSGRQYAERMSHRPGQHSIATSTPTLEEEAASRRWRNEEEAEQEMRERRRELAERERDIEARARELERERARLTNFRDAINPNSPPKGKMSTVTEEPHTNESPRVHISPLRPRRISLRKQLQRPLSQMEIDEEDRASSIRPRSSSTNQNADAVGKSGYASDNQPRPHQSPTRSRNSGDHRERDERQATRSPHAPYCGCDACSASKYRNPSTSTDASQDNRQSSGNLLRPPISFDKPKSGWMRRLSMPGGLSSAFNLDSKRNNTGGPGNFSLGSGISSANVSSKGLYGKSNSSATSLLRSPANAERVQEDGWLAGGNDARQSHEAHRSMTNLVGSRR